MASEGITRLLEVMARLRDPQNGCPWDLKQTFTTIAPHTLEEAYEVVDAIEHGDSEDIKDELGDLLFHIVFYAQMAREQEQFDFETIAQHVSDKLERRHPHVFTDQRIADEKELHRVWENRKAEERAAKTEQKITSALDGIAIVLPELLRAKKLQQRASRVGFDWPESMEIFFKIEEELQEVKQTIVEGEGEERIKEEIGDLLFAVVNLARHLDINPEQALRSGNQKFERRFRAIEAHLAADGRAPEECELAELDALWDQVKYVE